MGKSSLEDELLRDSINPKINRERVENIKKVMTEVKRHFIPFNDLVKTPASIKYKNYNLMWNRDSAYSSFYITKFIENSKKSGLYDLLKDDIDELVDLNSKLINTLWEGLNYEIKKICMDGYEKDISKPESKLGKNHVLSRFDLDYSGIKRAANDSREAITTRSWTMQYDSAPLILMATEEYIKAFGTDKIGRTKDLINKNLDFIVNYLYNFYKTPCADAWEQYYYYQKEDTVNGPSYVGKTIDCYMVASIYRGIKSADEIAKTIKVNINKVNTDEILDFIESEFVINNEKRGTFLAKSKIEFGETMHSIGAEEIEIFNNFIPDKLNKYSENTLKVMDSELFDGEKLPIRSKFFGKNRNIIDRYFGRGQWFHLGLQYAMYLKKSGNYDKAEDIIRYVENKIGDDGSIPEQELVEKKRVSDPDMFFERNNNKTIECLFWAETAYLAAASML